VDEVDVRAVDLRDELRQLVQPRLDPPEVVLVQPVARERPRCGELHPLRPILDEFLARPARRGDAPPQIVDLLFRKLDLERPNRGPGLADDTHETTSPVIARPRVPTLRVTGGVRKRAILDRHLLLWTLH
jgi:hypothetical protein